MTPRVAKCHNGDEVIVYPEFHDALIGFAPLLPGDAIAAVYGDEKCIEILVRDNGMSREEAEEYFDFNVGNAYYGPGTPIFVSTVESVVGAMEAQGGVQ